MRFSLVILPTIVFLLLLSGMSRANSLIVYKTIAYESSGESLEAQTWVAKVIQNRADRRGTDYERECLRPRQFSCWNEGINSKMKKRTSKELEVAKIAWTKAQDLSVNVDHYHDISVNPYWAKSMKKVKQIGRLVFYASR